MLESVFENIFELEQEDLDAVRMEAQAISPRLQRELEELIPRLHQEFLKAMGSFLAFEIDPLIMREKFITTSQEMYEEFLPAWINLAGRKYQSYADYSGEARCIQDEGNFVVAPPPDLWRWIPQEIWDALLKERGLSERELTDKLCELEQSKHFLHEITHLYQMNSELTPLWLMESQAYWVARGYLQTKESEAIAGFFQYLLDKYGNEIHRLCFGKSTDRVLAASLTEEFTPEVQAALFPHYRQTKFV